jgi:hypothetical protein
MKTKSDESTSSGFSMIMKCIEMIMSIVYVTVGALVIWRAVELFHIPNQYSLPLGSMLIAYGLFRTYRVYQKYFKK